MEQKVLIFGNQYVNKNAFYKHKKPISIDEVDITKIVLSKKDSYSKKGSFKYFMRHIKHVGVIPLCIKLPQMNAFAKYFDSNNKYITNFSS